MPNIVKPVTQAKPAKAPKITVIKIARTRFETSERMIRKVEDAVRESPKILRLENCSKIFGPSPTPSAMPTNIAVNKIP